MLQRQLKSAFYLVAEEKVLATEAESGLEFLEYKHYLNC